MEGLALSDLLPSIITGIITGALAIGGIVYTQRQTTARDDKARAHEQRAWAREQRRVTHAAFLAEQRRVDQWMMKVTRMGGSDVEMPTEGWYHPLSALLGDVQVFGSQDSGVAAQRLYRATLELQGGTVAAMARVDELRTAYRRHVQRDLGVDESELPPWTHEDVGEWRMKGVIPPRS